MALEHGGLQFVVFHNDELDAHRGLKSNLIERVQIGGVRDRQKQALAALHERQNPMLLHQLFADRPDGLHVRRHGVQVQ